MTRILGEALGLHGENLSRLFRCGIEDLRIQVISRNDFDKDGFLQVEVAKRGIKVRFDCPLSLDEVPSDEQMQRLFLRYLNEVLA